MRRDSGPAGSTRPAARPIVTDDERRLAPRRKVSTPVRFGSTGSMMASWAGLICDVSATGVLLLCEPHPQVEIGTSITIEDSFGRWVVGDVVRTAPHDHWALVYYGVALKQVSHAMETQFPAVALREREENLNRLYAYVRKR
jgi:hypothetical protein